MTTETWLIRGGLIVALGSSLKLSSTFLPKLGAAVLAFFAGGVVLALFLGLKTEASSKDFESKPAQEVRHEAK